MGIPDFRKMREQAEAMRAAKNAVFPYGSTVSVNSTRFHGVGIVSRDESCPIEQLPVLVESLNVWWYPIEDCQPYQGKLSTWVRGYMRRMKMKRTRSKPLALQSKRERFTTAEALDWGLDGDNGNQPSTQQ